MPRVKFDYVVSFSSEDPDNPASNLLSWEVSKKKWLCGAGESSGSAVVQFDKAVKIGTVQLGAHHAAFVELLVGRSETPDQPFQVLVSSSVFLSPAESRRSAPAADKVRSFSHTAGDAAVWAQRWDRLRVVVSQPYNKHCKFGISFVHVFTPEPSPTPAPAPTPAPTPTPAAALLALDNLSSSEDEEFRPGELFQQHTARTSANNTTDTGAQIRRATSEAFKNASDSSSKLVKTPLSKDKHRKHDGNSDKTHSDNSDKHTAKADHIGRDDSIKTRNERHVDRQRSDNSTDTQASGMKRKRDDRSDAGTEREANVETPSNKRKRDGQSGADTSRQTDAERAHGDTRRGGDTATGRRRESDSQATDKQTTCTDPSRLLAGVVCALSGYVHPERSHIRRTAAALGAQVRPDWGPDCTHLICAFPKTPKLRAVRASPGGDSVPIVLGEWVTECSRLRRRLPEGWFATEPRRRDQRPTDAIAEEPAAAVSDDELDFVPGRRPASPGPTAPAGATETARDTSPRPGEQSADRSANSDVEFLVDERIQGAVELDDSASDAYGGSTDGEGAGAGGDEEPGPALPPLLGGARVGAGAPAALRRYVRAYGGTVVTMEEMEMADNEADGDDTVYVVCGDDAGPGGCAGRGGRRVGPQWVWDCHNTQTRVHVEPYLI